MVVRMFEWPRSSMTSCSGRPEFASRLATEWRTSGLGFDSAEAYRRTAAAWPQESRRSEVPWGVHRRLVPSPNRAELLDELIRRKGGRVTVSDAAEVGARPMPG